MLLTATAQVRAQTATPTPISERSTRSRWMRSSCHASTIAAANPVMPESLPCCARSCRHVDDAVQPAALEAESLPRHRGDGDVVGDRDERRTGLVRDAV